MSRRLRPPRPHGQRPGRHLCGRQRSGEYSTPRSPRDAQPTATSKARAALPEPQPPIGQARIATMTVERYGECRVDSSDWADVGALRAIIELPRRWLAAISGPTPPQGGTQRALPSPSPLTGRDLLASWPWRPPACTTHHPHTHPQLRTDMGDMRELLLGIVERGGDAMLNTPLVSRP